MLEDLTATDDCRALRLRWSDGGETVLPAEYLRQAARDAGSVRQRLDHGQVHVMPGIMITDLRDVGGYGVNVHFSDGHDRAIYPFAYLRALSVDFGK